MAKRPRRAAQASHVVLVVDDEDSLRARARRLLEREGYRVLDAGTAAAAERLAKVYVGPIHVLLIDTEVSGTSGLALSHRLRPAHPQLKVLFMSSRRRRKGQLDTLGPLLLKPFTDKKLALTIRSVLGAAG